MPQMRQTSGLLRDYWYAAARSDEVNARRPLGRVVLEERLVLWRGPDGRVVVFQDRCLHRNAPLSEGELFDGKLGCPYHGWTYDAEGRCVEVPSQPEVPWDACLPRFPVREQDGLVWVWMGYDRPDKAPFAMPYWRDPSWGTYYMTTMFDNEVTQLVENFMDVPHTVFVHRGWFRSRRRIHVRAEVERTADSVLVTYDQPADSIGFTGRILNPSGHPMVHTDRFYMPNVTRVDYDYGGETGFVITSTCTPEGPFRTRVYTLISYQLGSRRLNRLARPFLPFYTRRVIEQDVDIMRIQGQVLAHYADRSFRSTDSDLHHVWIESLRDWAASGGEGPRPEPARRDVRFWV